MKVVQRINNNVVVCLDSDGNQVVAMGRGIGFDVVDDIPLERIERTFYEVDQQQLSGLGEIPRETLALAVSIADRARAELDYELSPSLAFTLADHIEFAMRRQREGIKLNMPLAQDIEHSCPGEYRIARQAVRAINRQLGANLPEGEAVGIAMGLVNARLSAKTDSKGERSKQDQEMLEDIVEIVENEFALNVDRNSFPYSRFVTHLNYLFDRLHHGKELPSAASDAFAGMQEGYPQGAACVSKIAAHLEATWGVPLSEDEKLYLLLHVSRIV